MASSREQVKILFKVDALADGPLEEDQYVELTVRHKKELKETVQMELKGRKHSRYSGEMSCQLRAPYDSRAERYKYYPLDFEIEGGGEPLGYAPFDIGAFLNKPEAFPSLNLRLMPSKLMIKVRTQVLSDLRNVKPAKDGNGALETPNDPYFPKIYAKKKSIISSGSPKEERVPETPRTKGKRLKQRKSDIFIEPTDSDGDVPSSPMSARESSLHQLANDVNPFTGGPFSAAPPSPKFQGQHQPQTDPNHRGTPLKSTIELKFELPAEGFMKNVKTVEIVLKRRGKVRAQTKMLKKDGKRERFVARLVFDATLYSQGSNIQTKELDLILVRDGHFIEGPCIDLAAIAGSSEKWNQDLMIGRSTKLKAVGHMMRCESASNGLNLSMFCFSPAPPKAVSGGTSHSNKDSSEFTQKPRSFFEERFDKVKRELDEKNQRVSNLEGEICTMEEMAKKERESTLRYREEAAKYERDLKKIELQQLDQEKEGQHLLEEMEHMRRTITALEEKAEKSSVQDEEEFDEDDAQGTELRAAYLKIKSLESAMLLHTQNSGNLVSASMDPEQSINAGEDTLKEAEDRIVLLSKALDESQSQMANLRALMSKVVTEGHENGNSAVDMEDYILSQTESQETIKYFNSSVGSFGQDLKSTVEQINKISSSLETLEVDVDRMGNLANENDDSHAIDLESKILDLSNENMGLMNQLAATQMSSSELKKLEKELETKNEHIRVLETQMQRLMEEYNTSGGGDQRDEEGDTNTRVASLQAELSNAHQKIDVQNAQILDLQHENSTAKDFATSRGDESLGLLKKIEEYQKQVETVEEDRQSSLDRIELLELQLAKSNSELETAMMSPNEGAGDAGCSEAKYKELEKKHESTLNILQQLSKKFAILQAEKEAMVEQQQSISAGNEEQQSTSALDELKAKHSKTLLLLQEMSVKCVSLQNDLNKKNEENDTLKQAGGNADERDAALVRETALLETLKEEAGRIESLQATVKNLEDSLQVKEKEAESTIAHLDKELKKKDESLDDANKKIINLELAVSKAESGATEKLTSAQDMQEILKESLADESERAAEFESRMEKAEALLREKEKDAELALTGIDSELKKKVESLNAAQAKILELEMTLSRLEKDAEEQSTSAKATERALEDSLFEEKKRALEFESALRGTETLIQEKHEKNESAAATHQKELEEKDESLSIANARIAELLSNSSSNEKKSIQKLAEALEREHALKQSLADVEKEKEGAQTSLAAANERIAELDKTLVQGESDLGEKLALALERETVLKATIQEKERDADTAISRLDGELKTKGESLDEARARVIALESALAKNDTEAADKVATAEANGKILRESLAEEKARTSDLESRLSKAEALVQEKEKEFALSTDTEVSTLKKENETLRESLSKFEEGAVVASKKHEDDLAASATALKQQLQRSNALDFELRSMKEAMEKLESENAQMSKEVAAKSASSDDAHALAVSLETTKTLLEASIGREKDLEKSNGALQQNIDDLDMRFADQNMRLTQLQSSAKDAESVSETLRRSQSRVKELEEEISKSKHEDAKNADAFNSVIEQKAQEADTLRTKIRKLESVEKENEDLLESLSSAKLTIATLKEEAMSSSGDSKKLERQLSKSNEEVSKLKKSLETAAEQFVQTSNLKNELELMRADLVKSQEEARKSKTDLDKVQREHDDLASQVVTTKMELVTVKGDIDQLTLTNRNLKKELEAAQVTEKPKGFFGF